MASYADSYINAKTLLPESHKVFLKQEYPVQLRITLFWRTVMPEATVRLIGRYLVFVLYLTRGKNATVMAANPVKRASK